MIDKKNTMSIREESLLWQLIDGDCTPEERRQIEKMLSNDPALAREYEKMKRLHRGLIDAYRPTGNSPGNDFGESINRLNFQQLFLSVLLPGSLAGLAVYNLLLIIQFFA